MSVFNCLQNQFPIRNTAEEKQAFRSHVLAMTKGNGWQAREETNGEHTNLVFGDPETAKVLFTAHYDTPRTSLLPNLMLPCSRVLYWVYQIGIVLLLLLLPSIAAVLAFRTFVPLDYSVLQGRMALLGVYMVVYVLLFFVFLRGRKNPHNANDNTSGVSTVLEIMRSLPEETRRNAALILFDNEEKGKKGSKAWAADHDRIRHQIPVINFDCVGLGDHFIMIRNKTCNVDDAVIREAFSTLPGVIFTDASKAGSNSDHLSFDQGIGIVASKLSRHGILYTGRIHTPRDTEVTETNLLLLRDASVRLVSLLGSVNQ